jgi:hypothetical protein
MPSPAERPSPGGPTQTFQTAWQTRGSIRTESPDVEAVDMHRSDRLAIKRLAAISSHIGVFERPHLRRQSGLSIR